MRKICALLAFAAMVSPVSASGQPVGAPAVHVRSFGEGGRCWVLLHPFGASGRFWERRAPELARSHNVRVLSPDLPSHGRSSIVDRFDYRQATREIHRALQASCPRPALILGASSGGIIAMQLGAMTGSLVMAVGVGEAFSAANITAMRASAAAAPSRMVNAYAEQGEAQTAAIARHFGDLAALGTAPLLTRAEARRLSGRLIILQGDRDEFFRPEAAARLAATVPGSRVVWFAGADHLGPLAPPHAARLWALVGEMGGAALPSSR